MAEIVLEVPNISCEHCERTVKEALEPLVGVRSVEVDIPAKSVTVAYDGEAVTRDRMEAALAEEDYPVASSRPA